MHLISLCETANFESDWQKSSKSAQANCCLEVALLRELIAIRDSKVRRAADYDICTEQVILLRHANWNSFRESVRCGLPRSSGDLIVEIAEDGSARLESSLDGTVLRYTPSEWTAFVAGVEDGELSIHELSKIPLD